MRIYLPSVDNPKKPLHLVKPLTPGKVALAGKQRRRGCSSSSVKLPISVRPLFSLTPSAQRRKAGRCLASQCKSCKKETPRRFRALRSAPRALPLTRITLGVSLRETPKSLIKTLPPDNAWSKTNAVAKTERRSLLSLRLLFIPLVAGLPAASVHS